MRYLVATGAASTTIEGGDAPPIADGQVRVEVAFVAVCHSDIQDILEGAGEFPRRMGHEASGVVTESRAPGVAVGTRVAALTSDAYATEIVIGAEWIVPLDDDCSLEDGALAEPLACVIGGLERLSFRPAREIVVVGTGFMGLLATRYLAILGHAVHTVDLRPGVRDRAIAWGAVSAADPAELPEEWRMAQSFVIEATGTASGLQVASDLVAIDGTLGILGYHQSDGGRRSIDMQSWNFRALNVVSLHARDRVAKLGWMHRAQRAAALGTIVPSQLVNAAVGLDDLPQRFAHHPGPEVVKTVVRPNGSD